MGTLEQTASKWWRALQPEVINQPDQQVPSIAQAPICCRRGFRPEARASGRAAWGKQASAKLLRFTADTLWLRFDRHLPLADPGMPLRLTLVWPRAPSWTKKVRGHVLQVSSTLRGTEVMVAMERPSRVLLGHLAQYALQHGACEGAPLTPQELRQRGFGTIDAGPCLRFGALDTPGEMAAIKQLRFDVFRQSALLKPTQNHPDDTEDERDRSSHILTAYWHDQLVATCRVYAMRAHDAYEFDAWAQGTDMLPPKDACVELGRAAIDPAFRNAGVPLQLFRLITAHTMASGRRYMVLGTQPALVPFYRCFGFVVTPIRFAFPGRKDFLAHVLVADLHALWQGKQGNPLVWYALFGSLPKECAQGFYAPRTAQEKLRVELYRRLGLVSRSVNHCLSWQGRWRRLMRP